MTDYALDVQSRLVYKSLLDGVFSFGVFIISFPIATTMKTLFGPCNMSSQNPTISTSQVPEAHLHRMNTPIVIELFQSQGCSSCPASNSHVLKFAEDPNMLILTYHVTYWDRLGWKDTFGDSVFDQRQWEYAKALQRKNVFTPQVRHRN